MDGIQTQYDPTWPSLEGHLKRLTLDGFGPMVTPKVTQNGHMTDPIRANLAKRRNKNTPKTTDPRWLWARGDPKVTQNGPNTDSIRPNLAKLRSKSTPKTTDPRWFWAQGNPKVTQMNAIRTQYHPIWPSFEARGHLKLLTLDGFGPKVTPK